MIDNHGSRRDRQKSPLPGSWCVLSPEQSSSLSPSALGKTEERRRRKARGREWVAFHLGSAPYQDKSHHPLPHLCFSVSVSRLKKAAAPTQFYFVRGDVGSHRGG
ncbi:hypothetical protein MCOR25_008149 [Pyricularia grisea]|nr:hypothetical protein MCOR25_008149 [Pyricularia grisea]